MNRLRICNNIFNCNRVVRSTVGEVNSRSFLDVNKTQIQFFRRSSKNSVFVLSTNFTDKQSPSEISLNQNVTHREKKVVSPNGNKIRVFGASQSSGNYGFIHRSNSILSASSRSRINSIDNVRHYSDASPPISTAPEIRLTGIWKSISESVPVEFAQDALIWLHTTTGLPWWATIVAATFIIRTVVTLPLALHQIYILAKVQNLKYEFKSIVEQLHWEAQCAIDQMKLMDKYAKSVFRRSAKAEWQKLVERDNCHPAKAGIIVLFQIPLWITLSAAIRNLCYMLPYHDEKAQAIYTELMTGGFGWIQDLTHGDSTFILPITFAVLNLTLIEFQVMLRQNDPSKAQRYLTNVFRVFTVCLIPLAAYVPAGMSLYWTSSSAYGIVQNFILVSPRVRRFVRIPETETELEEPYKHFFKNLRNRFGLKEIALPRGVKKL